MNFDFIDRDDFWEDRLSEDKRKFYFAKFFTTDKQHFEQSKLKLVFTNQKDLMTFPMNWESCRRKFLICSSSSFRMGDSW